MNAVASMLRVVAVSVVVMSCGGGGGGGGSGRAVVIPDVAPGAYETACHDLCTLAAGDKICTAKHAEFCVARCRASTHGLPTACADCLIAAGTPIAGDTDSFGEEYCHVGGPAELPACAAACDDGAGQPAPELETLCQLYCALYVQDPTVLACSVQSSADCLATCRTTIAAKGRACAQCLTEQTRPGRSCFNNDCDCLNSFDDSTAFGCKTLCDGVPATAM